MSRRLGVRLVGRHVAPLNAALRPEDGTLLPLSACDCDNYHSCHCDHDTCDTDVNVCVGDLDASGFIDTEVEVCAAFGWG